jgi:hypothetical protein
MSSHITPPPVKFELHAYGQTHDVSSFLLDWQENEVILSRKDTSGVYMEVTFPFKFVLDAYDIVEAVFEEYGFKAKADMYICLLNNDWTYGEPFIFNLDFSTYEQSDTVIEINSRRSDLYEQLKEKESVDFDIPVNDVKEDLRWNFERIKLENTLTMTGISEVDNYVYMPPNSSIIIRTIGTTYLNTEISVTKKIEEKTVSDNKNAEATDFFIATYKEPENEEYKPVPIYIIITEFKIKGSIALAGLDPSGKNTVEIGLFNKIDGSMIKGKTFSPTGSSAQLEINDEFPVFGTNLDKENNLYFLIKINQQYRATEVRMQQRIEASIKMKYYGEHSPVNIDIINPNRLLQKLVDKITETEEYTGNPPCPAMIENFNEDDQDLTMLVAAESIRGFERTEDYMGAKVHTSYKDFKEWMATQGYEPFINGNQLTFRKREKVFDKSLSAIELQEEECADLKIGVEKDYLFSGLKIGYKRKEYENANGRFEFNGLHDYATDYTGNAKALELISPYRADGYGIEFLLQTRGKDTTDDKSDKDLFFVNVKKGSEACETVYRTMTDATNVIHPYILETLFNAKYNPRELLKLNAGLLGASVNTLKFTASDANKDIAVNGEKIDGDYTIPEEAKLFDAVTCDFASRNIQELPSGDNINGVVRIHYREKIYEGFIREISKNPAWGAETQWVLFKKHSV